MINFITRIFNPLLEQYIKKISHIIDPLLETYFKKISNEQIEIDIQNRKVKIYDLDFQEDSFIHHHIPFYIKRGTINSVTITYSSDQCEINIENLFLIGSEVYGSTLIPNNLSNRPKSVIKKYILSIIQSILNIFIDSSLDTMRHVLDNLTISIQKVHIRIEGLMKEFPLKDLNDNQLSNTDNNQPSEINGSGPSNLKNYQSFDVIIQSINMFTIDQEGEKIVLTDHPPIFSKRIIFNYFGIYFDTKVTPIDKSVDLLKVQMANEIQSEENDHQFILSPFSFNCVFTYNATINTILNVQLILNKFKFSIDQNQYEALKKLASDFKIQSSFNFLERPFRPPRSERSSTVWWGYAHRCIVYKKTKFQKFNIQKALNFLSKRKDYYEVWKKYILNTNRYKKEYKEFINKLDPKTLLLLRDYSILTYSKSMPNCNKKYLNELNNETRILFPSEYSIKIERDFELCIKDNIGKPLINLILNGFSANGKKSQDLNSPSQKVNHSISFDANSMCLYNYTNERYRKPIEINDEINGSVEFNFSDPIYISLNASSFSFILDIELFSIFSHFFGDINSFYDIPIKQQNKIDIQAMINSHKKINLELKFGNTNILIPYQGIIDDDDQLQPIFQISSESFEVNTASDSKYDIYISDSLYDDYSITLNSLQLFLDKDKILNQIDIKTSIKYRIVPINNNEKMKINCQIPPLELRLTIFQVLLMKELFTYFSDKILNDSFLKSIFLMLNLIPDFNILLDIQSISAFLLYEDSPALLNTESYKIIMNDHTLLKILYKDENLKADVSNKSGIEVFDFFTFENGKLMKTKGFDVNITSFQSQTSVKLNIDDIDINAKAVPLNFLIVLAEFPNDYEWMLHLKNESSIKKYLYITNKKRKTHDVNIDIKLTKVKACLIDSELIQNDQKNVEIVEKELLTLKTNQILISVKQNENENITKIEISPPQATTYQFGSIWTDVISNRENPQSPILINLTPTSVTFGIDYFQANLSPLLLSKIIKFALIIKNPYSLLHGDPQTVKYMKFNINIKKAVLKIIYDSESQNYYELNISEFQFGTIKAPIDHLISFKKLQIVQKMQHKKDYPLFKIKNMNFILGMQFLIRENVNQQGAKSFSELLDETGLDEWTQKTMDFIEYCEDEKILCNSYFYFYALDIKFEFNELFCVYSHELAKNITYLSSCLLDILKRDKYYNYENHSFQTLTKPLNISVNLKSNQANILLVDSFDFQPDSTNGSYLPMAKLTIDSINLEINPNKWIYNALVDKIIIIGDNNEKILETGILSIETLDEDIFARLESFYLNIKLQYLPDSVYYIMNCPFFSFMDEFKENNPKQTSFEMKMGLFIYLNDFKVTLPIKENSFHLNSSFDISLTPEGSIAQVQKVHMLLNDRLIMKHFSIQFSNDTWDVDPIFITYSVFEMHIIHDLIKESNSLIMPPIYVFKKEAELNKRKYTINLKKIDIILTQPNLPFITLEIKPSTFKQNYSNTNENDKIIEYKVEMLLKHENYSNFGTDIIIDPFEVSIKSSSHDKKLEAEISPINIALSSSFLSEIFQFQKKYSIYKNSNYDSKIFQERIIRFQNDTSVPIKINLIKRNTHELESIILDNNKPFKLNDYDLKSKINIEFQNEIIEFYIHNLCYSFCFKQVAVLYLVADVGVQTIHFSSPYIIQNKLFYTLNVYIDNNSMGIIKRDSEVPVPIPFLKFIPKGMKVVNNSDPKSLKNQKVFKINNQQLLYKFNNEMNDTNFYSSICITNDLQRPLRYVTFLPYITYENQLPVTITLCFLNYNNIVHELKTGHKYDVSYLKDKMFKLKIKISIDVFGESDSIEVPTFSTNSNPIEIPMKWKKEEKCKIALICEHDEKTNTYHNIIYAPCVIYNKTGAILSLKDSKEKYYPFLNNMCFYSPEEFFNPKPFKQRKVPLRVMLKDITKQNDTKINCMEIKSIQNFSLPFISNENVLFQLSAVKIESQFENVTHLALIVHFTLFNHLNADVFLIPSNVKKESKEFSIRCKPMKKSLIGPSNLEGTFSLYIYGYRKCKCVNLKNQTTTIFRLVSKCENKPDFLIQLDVIKEKEGFCGHLSYPTFPSPIVISNMLSNCAISVKQKTEPSKYFPMVISSCTTSLYAKPQPFIEQNSINENCVAITIIRDKPISFNVSFSIDISPQQIQKTNYSYEVRTTQRGDKMILITENNKNNNKSSNAKENDKQNMVRVEMPLINIHFSKIGVSFIDKFMRELCLLVVKNINHRIEKRKSVLLTIESFRLNDMYANSKSPVVLCEKSPRFLSIEINSELPLKMHSYESIIIDVSPIHAFIDSVFISDLFYAINDVIIDSKISKDNQQDEFERDNNFSRYSFYSVKQIRISPILIDCTKINSLRTNRLPTPEKFSTYLLIGKYLFLPLSLSKCFEEYKNSNIRAPLNNFMKSLTEVYFNQFSLTDLLSMKILKDSSLIKVSSEKFVDTIDNQDENDLKRYKKKGLITLPERIPRAFPMNRIRSVFVNDNRNEICQYSLAQFTFQIDNHHHHEYLLLMIPSKKESNFGGSFLCIFNHFVVHLSENLRDIYVAIKIDDLKKINIDENQVILASKKDVIRFTCDDSEDSKLIFMIIRSISDTIQFLRS